MYPSPVPPDVSPPLPLLPNMDKPVLWSLTLVISLLVRLDSIATRHTSITICYLFRSQKFNLLILAAVNVKRRIIYLSLLLLLLLLLVVVVQQHESSQFYHVSALNFLSATYSSLLFYLFITLLTSGIHGYKSSVVLDMLPTKFYCWGIQWEKIMPKLMMTGLTYLRVPNYFFKSCRKTVKPANTVFLCNCFSLWVKKYRFTGLRLVGWRLVNIVTMSWEEGMSSNNLKIHALPRFSHTHSWN